MGMIGVGYRLGTDGARELRENPDLIEDVLESDGDLVSVDVDKSWHGIHWLLTDSEEPTDVVVSEALFGGEIVGGNPWYRPARLLSADRVSVVASARPEVHVDALRPPRP